MRFVPNKRPLPRNFCGGHPHASGLVAEADIFPCRKGRLAAKLLVFDGVRSLHRFWKKALNPQPLGRGCLGAVNGLFQTRQRVGRTPKEDKPEVMTGDRRYFCVIGLSAKHLSAEIVMHEAVHAGFCYAKRVRRDPWGPAKDFDEEWIAYPSGAIAAGINDFLHAKGLHKRKAKR